MGAAKKSPPPPSPPSPPPPPRLAVLEKLSVLIKMAGGAIVNTGGGKEYPGKMTLFVFLSCLVASSGGLIFGYDIGISGGVTSMEPFLAKFFPSVLEKEKEAVSNNQYCKFDSPLLTAFTSSLYLAALVASLLASTVTRLFGRKWSMFGGGITFLAGSAIIGAAENVLMLILGRILLGIGVGFANQSVPLYLSEMAPAKLRGMLNIGFQLMITIGILAANFINYGTNQISGVRFSLWRSVQQVKPSMFLSTCSLPSSLANSSSRCFAT